MKLTYPHLSLRSFALSYEDLPAFHAAYFMLVVIFAGLCNLGFFAAVIALHLAIDVFKYHTVQKMKPHETFIAVFRENLTDLALFFLALSSVVFLHPELPSIAILTGSSLNHVTIMRGLAVLLPKLTILHHSVRILFHLSGHIHAKNVRLISGWTLTECLSFAVLLIALFLLVLAPPILHLTPEQFQSLLGTQL